jgi:hypothetical protein
MRNALLSFSAQNKSIAENLFDSCRILHTSSIVSGILRELEEKSVTCPGIRAANETSFCLRNKTHISAAFAK